MYEIGVVEARDWWKYEIRNWWRHGIGGSM